MRTKCIFGVQNFYFHWDFLKFFRKEVSTKRVKPSIFLRSLSNQVNSDYIKIEIEFFFKSKSSAIGSTKG